MSLQKSDTNAKTGATDNEPIDQMTALGLTNNEDLSLRVSMYSIVLQIHSDTVRIWFRVIIL